MLSLACRTVSSLKGGKEIEQNKLMIVESLYRKENILWNMSRFQHKVVYKPLQLALTVLGATADPEIQHLVFLGLRVFSGVIAQPHPQASPRSCDLQK